MHTMSIIRIPLALVLLLGFNIKCLLCILKAAKLRTWLEAGGAYINPNVEVEVIPNIGYGLKAKARIDFHETICCIPQELCMVSTGSNAVDNIATQLRNEKFLSSITKEDSYYQPFMDVLPDDLSYLPSMWSLYNLALLEGTSLVSDAKMMKASWLDAYNKLILSTDHETLLKHNNNNKEVKHVSISDQMKKLKDQWIWARATLQCRAYSFKLNKQKRIYGSENDNNKNNNIIDKDDQLVVFFPFIGFANHNDEKFCKVAMGNGVSESSTSIVVRTQSVYQPGEPICISYGDLSFNQKVLSFGWIDCSDSDSCAESDLHTRSYYITPIDIPSKTNDNNIQIEIKTTIPNRYYSLFPSIPPPQEPTSISPTTATSTSSSSSTSPKNKRPPSKLMMKHADDVSGTGIINMVREIDTVIDQCLKLSKYHEKETVIKHLINELDKKQIKNKEIESRLNYLKLLQEDMDISNSRQLYDLSITEAQYIISLEINANDNIRQYLKSIL